MGNSRFRVLGDGKPIPIDGWRKWIGKGSPQDPTCFTLDVSDVAYITLETDDNGEFNCDFSTWVDAAVRLKGNKYILDFLNCLSLFTRPLCK